MSLSPEILRWLESQIGDITDSAQLAGSSSTTLYRVTDANGTGYVLRLYDNEEWLAVEPDLCPHEAGALQWAQSASVKTPRLIAHEPDASVAGIPLLLMEQLEGEVWLQPDDMSDWLRQAAEALAAIHAVKPDGFQWQFYRYTRIHQLKVPSWSQETAKWEKIIDILKQPVPETPTVFIHRDYHMVNFLWKDKQLTGVVDWINACAGSAGMDIGHMRINLSSLYGIDIADQFLEAYQTANPDFEYLPYWDLVAIGDTALYGDEPPAVYPPWVDFGMTGLSDALMMERAENFAASVLSRI